jgi:hypothetical protein
MRLLEGLLGVIVAFIIFVSALYIAPTTWWYEYRSIAPVASVLAIGEPLKLVSTIRVTRAGRAIVFKDQLRCVTDSGDAVIETKVFPTALKGPVDTWKKTPWIWGKIPEETPKGIPCYIRSIQTLTTVFGIERVTEYISETFIVSDN